MRKSIICILCIIVIIVCCSCSNDEKRRVSVSSEEFIICENYANLMALKKTYTIDCNKYNESYFKDKLLIIFEFKTSFDEVIINSNYTINNSDINLDLTIDSPRAGFTPLSFNIYPIFIEFENTEVDKSINLLLYIENINLETIYYKNKSAFYDCRMKESNYRFEVDSLPNIDETKYNEIIEKEWPISIDLYLGNYNGYEVWFQRGDSQAVHNINLNDLEFTYGTYFELYAYKGEKFKLSEVYYRGLISDYQLYQIYQIYLFAYNGKMI